MRPPKLTRLELQILDVLWARGNASIREIQEAFPAPRPAYTTIQTTVPAGSEEGGPSRTEDQQRAHLRTDGRARGRAAPPARRSPLLFGGRVQPMMAQLVEAGKITLEDIKEVEKAIRERRRK